MREKCRLSLDCADACSGRKVPFSRDANNIDCFRKRKDIKTISIRTLLAEIRHFLTDTTNDYKIMIN